MRDGDIRAPFTSGVWVILLAVFMTVTLMGGPATRSKAQHPLHYG